MFGWYLFPFKPFTNRKGGESATENQGIPTTPDYGIQLAELQTPISTSKWDCNL